MRTAKQPRDDATKSSVKETMQLGKRLREGERPIKGQPHSDSQNSDKPNRRLSKIVLPRALWVGIQSQ
jgi:hypothetical protein